MKRYKIIELPCIQLIVMLTDKVFCCAKSYVSNRQSDSEIYGPVRLVT